MRHGEREKHGILLKTAYKWSARHWFNFELANVIKWHTAKSIKLSLKWMGRSSIFIKLPVKNALAYCGNCYSNAMVSCDFNQSIESIKVKSILWIISDRCTIHRFTFNQMSTKYLVEYRVDKEQNGWTIIEIYCAFLLHSNINIDEIRKSKKILPNLFV